jgi:hypothetical protein
MGTTAADAAGGDNPGSIVGPTWTTQGRIGPALTFDGTNDYVMVADAPSLDITAALTLEAWINPTTVSGGYRMILSKTTTGEPTNYYLGIFGDEVAFGFSVGSVWRDHVTSGVNLVTGTWRHVTAVYSDAANSVRIYVDGVERLSATETSTLAANAQQLRIGIGLANESFPGRIDEVRVYNRTLAATEIQADMTRPMP